MDWMDGMENVSSTVTPFVILQSSLGLAAARRVHGAVLRRWAELTDLPLYDGSLRQETLLLPGCLGWAGFLCDAHVADLVPKPGQVPINYSNRHGPLPHACNVFIDDSEVGELAAEHLIEKGYRRFFFVGTGDHGYSRDRQSAFMQALERRGFHAAAHTFRDQPTTDPAVFQATRQAAVRSWLPDLRGPTGVLAANDLTAATFLDLVRSIDADLLHTVAVVGVDNEREDLVPGGLTSIEPNFEGMGRCVAERLYAGARGEPPRAGEVVRIGGARLIERASTHGFSCVDTYIGRVARFLQREIEAGKPPSVESLSERFGTTPRTLLNRFKKESGQSLRDYMIGERLKRAARLLRESDHSIADIAFLCGFGKQGALSAHFQTHFGCSPRDYRKAGAEGGQRCLM